MSSVQGSSGGSDLARVEALHRLAVKGPGFSSEAFADLVALLVQMLGADAVSIVLVEHERAWTMASTSVALLEEVPRAWSLADIVVRSHEDVLVVDRSGDHGDPVGSRHLNEAGTGPATMAAHVLLAPGGQRIGAIEVCWDVAYELDERAISSLSRACALVTRMLELRAEVSEYGRFIDLTPDPVAILDLEGAIEQVNPAFVTMLEADGVDELVGRGFLEFVARKDRARITAELARLLFMRRDRGQLQLSLVGVDGHLIPCTVSAGHLRGTRRHLQLVVHDLSERLRAEDERSNLSEQLARAQRLDAVGQIAGGLAHDLNNLLVVMVSNLGLAQESLAALAAGDLAELEAVKQDLEELQVSVDRAGGLTSKLLQFARQEEGGDTEADVIEVLDAVRALLGRSLGDGVGLEVACPDELPPLAVEPLQLERVLVNLVINARDALEGPGTINIEASLLAAGTRSGRAGPEVERRADRRREGGLSSQRDRVRIAVIDNGRGMSEATKARAFEPLFTTKSASGGSGLGLATVLAFIEQADGQIELDSTEGQGTTVSLLLPIGDPEPSVPVGVDVPVAGARILLVDPGDRTRRVISAMLTGAGYRVTAVGSGEGAVEVLNSESFDLVVTELALPGMPGTRLIETVSSQHPTLRAVALASVDQPRTLEGTPVLVKPFSHTRLLRTVERVVKGH